MHERTRPIHSVLPQGRTVDLQKEGSNHPNPNHRTNHTLRVVGLLEFGYLEDIVIEFFEDTRVVVEIPLAELRRMCLRYLRRNCKGRPRTIDHLLTDVRLKSWSRLLRQRTSRG